jgi:hypothetical protein
MTVLKVDNITFAAASVDVTYALSGIATSGDYALATGLINPATNDIATTGIISGYTYKTSGNATVLSAAGAVTPYGLYALPSGVPVPNHGAFYTNTTQTEWRRLTTTAFSIALSKC